jgi:hypothetical protein
MHIEMVLGIALLLYTLWQVRQGETDTIFLFDWWLWFDISREKNPIIFWCCIFAQTSAGVGLVIHGFIKS